MTAPFKRSTNFPGGIAAGQPEDGGWDRTNQPVLLTIRLSSVAKTMTLPANTTLLETLYFPDPDSPASAGTFDLDDTTNTVNYLNDADATATANAAVSSPGQLAATTLYTATPTDIPAGEYVRVGFLCILPEPAP